MKNLATVLVLLFLATLVVLLWRLEGRLEPMAELARAQLADRAEARLAEQNRIAAEGRARAAAVLQEQATAQQLQMAAAAAQQREREELARRARLQPPVKPGEVVEEIYLDNHSTVRGAIVVAVQASSVSFKAGARLYNIPTDQLPAELQARVRRMFPPAPPPAPAPAAQPPPVAVPQPAAEPPAQP